jgi:hypothetical protein
VPGVTERVKKVKKKKKKKKKKQIKNFINHLTLPNEALVDRPGCVWSWF